MGNKETATATTRATTRVTTTRNPNSWTNVNMLSQCHSAFNELKEKSDLPEFTLIDIQWFLSQYNNYHLTIEKIFLNTSVNVSEIEEHRGCSHAINEAMEVLDVYQTIAELGVHMTNSDTLIEAFSYAIQIPPIFKMTNLLFTDEHLRAIDNSILRECAWLYDRSRQIPVQCSPEEFERLKKLTADIDPLLKPMIPLLHGLNDERKHKITIFTGKGQDYLDQKITKSKLSHEFASAHFLIYRENVGDLTRNLEEAIKEYNKEMILRMNMLKDVYKTYFNIGLPVINNYNVYQLNLGQESYRDK